MKTQAKLVLDYLMARPERKLTPLAAHTFLGVASLTSRIAEIRKAFGEDAIKGDWETDAFGRRFKQYWMTQESILDVATKRKEMAAA